MFDNIKKLYELKKMQDEIKKEKTMTESRGVRVVMDGSFGVEEIKLNSDLNIEDQQSAVKEAINKARDNIQKSLVKKMMSSGMSM